MPGPIFSPSPGRREPSADYWRHTILCAWHQGLACTCNLESEMRKRIIDLEARVDPMNLAAYGPSRPHVDGKMAPPGLPWVGKAKGRKRK